MQRHPAIFIAPSPLGGRGVFAAEAIEPGEVIEICPVIVLPPHDLPAIHHSGLHDYYFFWKEDGRQCAIALGYGSLYNHSHQPNASYHMDTESETIDFLCLCRIEPGDEITVNYNGHPADDSPVWFEEEN